MEQKTNALKISSKVIAVIMKIGYIAMIVAMCICASTLIFWAVTGGETSIVTSGGTNISIMDGSSVEPAMLIAVSVDYLVACGFLFAIFLLTYRVFDGISRTGEPFEEKYVKMIRVIGILVAAMTVAVGIADAIVSYSVAPNDIQTHLEVPGFVAGAVIFCLSYIIDYGCALKSKREE